MPSRLNIVLTAALLFIILVVVLAIGYDYIDSSKSKKVIRSHLSIVGEKLEFFKRDYDRYPTEEDLETIFSTDPRYTVPRRDGADHYATGLSMSSNFFYCVQDNPSKYVLLAAKDYNYALYITNEGSISEYNYEGVKPSDRPDDYPFHVHATAQSDICPKFLPGFTSSANGYGDRGGQEIGWARWTGIE